MKIRNTDPNNPNNPNDPNNPNSPNNPNAFMCSFLIIQEERFKAEAAEKREQEKQRRKAERKRVAAAIAAEKAAEAALLADAASRAPQEGNMDTDEPVAAETGAAVAEKAPEDGADEDEAEDEEDEDDDEDESSEDDGINFIHQDNDLPTEGLAGTLAMIKNRGPLMFVTFL